MKRSVLTLSLSALLMLTACANLPRSTEQILSDRGFQRGETVDRIKDYQISGWNYVDERHVIFNAGPSRNYLITLKIDCRDLSGAEYIGFSSTTSDVTRFDKVVVGTPIGPRSCPIDTLTKLEKID